MKYFLRRIRIKIELRKFQLEVRKSGTPVTIDEKLRWKSAFDRRKLITTFADKILVREYVAHKIGTQHLTRIYQVSYKVNGIDWRDLPKEFVIKVNHGSGGIVIVWSGAQSNIALPKNIKNEVWTRYQIQPKNLNVEDLKKLFSQFLKTNYCWYKDCNRIPEWAYLNIKPGILVEELLLDNEGNIPLDYKFWMFDGKCKFITVTNRNSYSRDLFTPKWNWIDVKKDGLPNSSFKLKKPKNLSKMLEIVEKLSEGIDFLRVDLFDLGTRIVFGELTNYPNAAMNLFDPPEYQNIVGDWLKLQSHP